MLVTDAVAIVFILLYFWYMTWASTTPVPKPTAPYPSQQSIPIDYHVERRYGFQLHVHLGQFEWNSLLPTGYTVHDSKIVQKDACYGQTDGTLVPATGPTLYQMFQTDQLVPFPVPETFETDASTTQQDKRIYYYTCESGRIRQVHQCPPGTLFQNGSCQGINPCTGQPDDTKVANAYDVKSYFLCKNEQARFVPCHDNSVFVHDNCREEDVAQYCQHHTEPRVLNPLTLLVCQQGQVTYETCPPGYQYFDQPKCESDVCVGKRDGERIPLPVETMLSFQYSPGFMTCQADKVDHMDMCPSQWDRYLGDRLTILPQVFDGNQCTIPELCTNVTPTDPDIIVPDHHFTKHVRNWAFASHFDQVAGYTCEGKARKRVTMEPGQRIGKRFKRESACDKERAPVHGSFTSYFDCATQQVVSCPDEHYFDGIECRPNQPHAFKFEGIHVFKLDGLSEFNWIKPWDYRKPSEIITACTDPTFLLNHTYNLCSHPDCVHYPFLSQIKFKIGHKDGSECVYNEPTREIVKQTTSSHYLFWSQRKVPEPPAEDPCVPGQHLASGNFVFDQTMFATCHKSQPFVFCPSSKSTKVLRHHNRWHCWPDNGVEHIPPRSKREYVPNELFQIKSEQPTHIKINGYVQQVPSSGLDLSTITEHITLETLQDDVKVYRKYLVTHPPDIVLNGQTRQTEASATTYSGFLVKRASFTKKPLHFPTYEIQPSVPDFFIQSR